MDHTQTSKKQDAKEEIVKFIKEGFKKKSDFTADVKIELFFVVRCLLMRYGREEIAKLLPYLMSELSNVFTDSKLSDQNKGLIYAGLKIIELLSSKNEDFQMQQWMFLFDGYGMQKCDNTEKIMIQKVYDETVEKSKDKNKKAGEKREICQPYLVQHLKNSYKLYST